MKVGTWKAILADWGVIESGENKTPTVMLTLSVDVGGELEDIKAYLYLSEKAKERSIRTMWDTLGFNGKVEDLAAGRNGGALEGGKEIQVEIGLESYNGKERHKVKWINPVGYISGGKPLPKAEAIGLLAGLKGDIMAGKPAGGANRGLDLD